MCMGNECCAMTEILNVVKVRRGDQVAGAETLGSSKSRPARMAMGTTSQVGAECKQGRRVIDRGTNYDLAFGEI